MTRKFSVKKMLFIAIAMLALQTCTTLSRSARLITLDQAESVPPGTSRAEILKIFGQPDLVPNPKNLTAPSGIEYWIYLIPDKKIPRLTLEMDTVSERMISSNFSVYDGDSEISIDFIQKRYPSAKFQALPVDLSQHTIPDDIEYADDQRGMGFTFRQMRKEVSSIGWWIPEKRTVAGENKDVH